MSQKGPKIAQPPRIVDVVATHARLFTIHPTPDFTGQSLLNLLKEYGHEQVVIMQSHQGRFDSIFSSKFQQNAADFFNQPLTSRLKGNDQRVTLTIFSLEEHTKSQKLSSLKDLVPFVSMNPHLSLNITLPSNHTITIQTKPNKRIFHVIKKAYQKMVEICTDISMPPSETFRLVTSTNYTPPPALIVEECTEVMRLIESTKTDPFARPFFLKKISWETDFTKTINDYVKSLELATPSDTEETHLLHIKMSEIRQQEIANRTENMERNPLFPRIRLSSTYPPFFKNKQSGNKNDKGVADEVMFIVELAGSIFEAEMNRASFKIPRTESADRAIEELFKRIYRNKKIFPVNPYDYVLIPVGSDEVIAGNEPLEHFVCVREFLLSSQLTLNASLEPKSNLLETILQKEVKPLPEPELLTMLLSVPPPTTRQEISFESNPVIPHSNVTVHFRIEIRTILNLKGVRRVQVKVALLAGSEYLCNPKLTSVYLASSKCLLREFVEIPLPLSTLPRITRISLTVFDCDKKEGISTLNFALFDYNGWANTGYFERKMWPRDNVDFYLTTCEPTDEDAVMIIFNIPVFEFPVAFNSFDKHESSRSNRSSIFVPEEDKKKIDAILSSGPLHALTQDEKRLVFMYRYSLPLPMTMVLHSIDYANPAEVSEVPSIIEQLTQPDPVGALALLGPDYPDLKIRNFAIQLLDKLSDSELMLYCLQIVQALKYELYDVSPLALFLVKRALREPKFLGHAIFWQLISECHLSYIQQRFSAILVNLMYGMGVYRKELLSGYLFTQQLHALNAECFSKTSAESTQKLREKLRSFELPEEFHLPIDSRIIVKRFVIDECRVMSSKKKPFWLSFESQDQSVKTHVQVLYKVGDDLRQDQLILQVMKVMEHLWRINGLEMQMRLYGVLPTGFFQGFVEIVPNSVTEANIQVKAGKIEGVLRDDLITKYLQSICDRRQYPKAIDHFFYSFAGYSVATAILGVADRHPDNVMIQSDGHFFHIDFGHFLGNFKMKLGYQRENAPFHGSPALHAVVQERAEEFVQLCGRAYNIIRQNVSLMTTLLMLMLGTGIPELQKPSDLQYMIDMLHLGETDEEAVETFRGFIQESVSSVKTKINNAAHNIFSK